MYFKATITVLFLSIFISQSVNGCEEILKAARNISNEYANVKLANNYYHKVCTSSSGDSNSVLNLGIVYEGVPIELGGSSTKRKQSSFCEEYDANTNYFNRVLSQSVVPADNMIEGYLACLRLKSLFINVNAEVASDFFTLQLSSDVRVHAKVLSVDWHPPFSANCFVNSKEIKNGENVNIDISPGGDTLIKCERVQHKTNEYADSIQFHIVTNLDETITLALDGFDMRGCSNNRLDVNVNNLKIKWKNLECNNGTWTFWSPTFAEEGERRRMLNSSEYTRNKFCSTLGMKGVGIKTTNYRYYLSDAHTNPNNLNNERWYDAMPSYGWNAKSEKWEAKTCQEQGHDPLNDKNLWDNCYDFPIAILCQK
ncbi:hypothetical protein [Teredinibacter turnerae]|uniref:hypothetical protein n=1 Tax=Teredinibacter turnerae TaxID=2426 RepID=UPI0005F83628|nr:hypothetical protein [Teredinibacter turnerae]